jgi:cytoskeletal protein RodZ
MIRRLVTLLALVIAFSLVLWLLVFASATMAHADDNRTPKPSPCTSGPYVPTVTPTPAPSSTKATVTPGPNRTTTSVSALPVGTLTPVPSTTPSTVTPKPTVTPSLIPATSTTIAAVVEPGLADTGGPDLPLVAAFALVVIGAGLLVLRHSTP